MSAIGESVDTTRRHKRWSNFTLAILIILAVAIRLSVYGDLRLSLATADTSKFIRASSLPLLSLDFWTSVRPPIPALLYKLLLDDESFSLTAISEPAAAGKRQPEIQPEVSRIAVAQKAISITTWTILALVLGTSMRHPLPRLMAPAFTLAFAFNPPLVEWDSVLMSESLSFSLFALLLALTILLARRVARKGSPKEPAATALWVAWASTFSMWVFTRDANAHALPVTAALLAAALLALRAHPRALKRTLLIALAVTLGLFWIHSTSLQRSERWVIPFFNNLTNRVFPFPDRVAFFEDRGMPISEELLALQESRGNARLFYAHPEFMQWVRAAGLKTYVRSIAEYPIWAFGSFNRDLEFLFSENRQPYFLPKSQVSAPRLIPHGDLLHATSSAIVAADILLLAILLCIAWRNRNPLAFADAWTGAWMVGVALVILFASYHGDSVGMIRHAMAGVLLLRLALWIIPVLILDHILMDVSAATPSTQGRG